jgi:thiosulfate dehydrogenase (quinone) large subunit
VSEVKTFSGNKIEDPKFVQALTSNTKYSVVWLLLRIWLGLKWIDAASHKLGNDAWVKTGDALKGFWMGAVAIPAEGRPSISFDWYRNFLQGLIDSESYKWFSPLVAYGEYIVGLALILGLFTGVAAFFGALMNWNFMMAGSASSNPMLFIVALGIMFAWKISGYYGLDFYVLRKLGTPWKSKPIE